MTSCVLSFSVFVFLCSSITVSAHTGVRVRITNRAQDVLKETGLTLFRALRDKSFKGYTITSLDLHDINIQFQDSKLQFVITDLNLAVRSDSLNGAVTAHIAMGLRLSRTQNGRLNVLMPDCKLTINNINSGHNKQPWDTLLKGAAWIAGRLPSSWLCAAVDWFLVPKLNTWLENTAMMTMLPKTLMKQAKLPENLEVKVDYSLSGDVEMSPNGIDVSFKGSVLCQDEVVVPDSKAGADPVFTENDMMAYVGVSEFFFNSAAISLYGAGVMKYTDQVTHGGEKAALRFLQFFRNGTKTTMKLKRRESVFKPTTGGTVSQKPTRLPDPLSHEVEVTELPNFGISQKEGLTVTIRARFRALAASPTNEPSPFMSVSARCQVSVKVTIEENHLRLPSDNVDCNIVTKDVIRDLAVKPLNSFLTGKVRSYLQGAFNNENAAGIPIPLPDGISFTQLKVVYHDGFLVVGGSLVWTPAGRQNLVNLIV